MNGELFLTNNIALLAKWKQLNVGTIFHEIIDNIGQGIANISNIGSTLFAIKYAISIICTT